MPASPVRAAAAAAIALAVLGGRGAFAATTADPGAEPRSWTVGNALVAADVRFTADGRVVASTLWDRTRGLNWAHGDGGLGFRVVLRAPSPDAPPTADPGAFDAVTLTEGSAWTLVRAELLTAADKTSRLELDLDSREAPVSVRWTLATHPESPVFRSSLRVANTGDARVLLEAVDGLDVGLGTVGGTLSSLTVNNFSWRQPAASLETNQATLKPGTSVSARSGADGSQAAWLALRSSTRNAGLFAGWEWSGPGLLAAAAGADGAVRLRVGFAPGTFAHVLGPAGTFTAPGAFLGTFSGNLDAAGAATRAFVTRRIAPPLPAPDFPWVGFNTWGYSLGLADWQVETLIDRAAAIGAEFFTLDAGWAPRLGDWWADPARYRNGLRDVAARAHAKGMKFGLWIALGAADPASQVVRDHPDWLARVGGTPVATDFDGVALCLGDARVRAWVLAQVDRLSSEASLDWLVHDFTVITGCDEAGHSHQAGDGWWASTAGYYAVLDEIRRRHPKLVLENCWDGGQLLDFGMVARHDTSATSDRNDAYGNQRAVFGGTYFLPPRYLDKYVGDDGTPDAYRFLSGLPGGPMIFMGILTSWSAETEAAARAAAALFKQNRVLNRDGAVYHLTGQPGSGAFTAIESYDSKTGAGVIAVWGAPGAAAAPAGSSSARVLPVGLASTALYDVAVLVGIPGARTPQALPADTGANLMSAGIAVTLPASDGAALVTLTKR